MLNEHQSLTNRLREADRSWQKEKGKSFLLRSLKFVFAAVLILFVLDVALHLGATNRVILLAVFIGGILAVLGAAYYIARIRKNRLETVARLLETQETALGSKVINILQLEQQTTDENLPPLTRILAAEAVQSYSRELAGFDFQKISRLPRLKMDFKQALWAIAIFTVGLAIFHEIALLEFTRFGDPFGDHPAYSFTHLTMTDPGMKGGKVIYGKNTIVNVKFSGHEPKELFLTFFNPQNPAKKTTVPMFGKGKAGFTQQIENVKSDLIVFAHTKNLHSVSKQGRIDVILTPKVEKAFVKISPPAYTGIKPEENPFQFKTVKALADSEVEFRLQSNRPLREGVIEFRKADSGVERIAMSQSGEHEVSARFAAKDSGRLRFTLTDVAGIASEDLFEGMLTVTQDLAPEIAISEPNKDCFISMDYKIEAQIETMDDYGVKMIRVHRALNGVYSAPKVISYDQIVRTAREAIPFDFKDLGVQPGDVVSIFAEAIDTSPAAQMARSQTLNITMISEDDYNNFLRQQNDISDLETKYSDLLNQLQDRIDDQKNISEKLEALKKSLANASAKDKNALEREVNALEAKQPEINSKLDTLADEMDKFVRKNPVYDVESEFQDILSQKAEAIRKSTESNNDSMKNLASQKLDQRVLDDFKNASDEQLNKLGAAEHEAEKQIGDTVHDLSQMQEILKDFNHFEQLYEAQQSLAEQNRAYNSSASLSREDQLALRNLAAGEKQVEDELRELAEKLRSDAKAAQQKFPKAAKSAGDLATAIDQQRMPPLANQATSSMLAGEGEKSSQLSEKLRGEMEKLFSQCQSQGQQQNDELDNYLKLQRAMRGGNTFKQMMQSRKFGSGKSGASRGKGQAGQGTSGSMITSSPSFDVIGNETRISHGEGRQHSSHKVGMGHGKAEEQSQVEVEKPSVLTGVKSVNRNSDAVSGEAPIDQYDDLVDKYFKTITK